MKRLKRIMERLTGRPYVDFHNLIEYVEYFRSEHPDKIPDNEKEPGVFYAQVDTPAMLKFMQDREFLRAARRPHWIPHAGRYMIQFKLPDHKFYLAAPWSRDLYGNLNAYLDALVSLEIEEMTADV